MCGSYKAGNPARSSGGGGVVVQAGERAGLTGGKVAVEQVREVRNEDRWRCMAAVGLDAE